MCRIICLKKVRLIKNISINIFQKINNLIVQGLLSAVDYIKSKARYKNKKQVYYNQLIN